MKVCARASSPCRSLQGTWRSEICSLDEIDQACLGLSSARSAGHCCGTERSVLCAVCWGRDTGLQSLGYAWGRRKGCYRAHLAAEYSSCRALLRVRTHLQVSGKL